jgi:hypothetical protein
MAGAMLAIRVPFAAHAGEIWPGREFSIQAGLAPRSVTYIRPKRRRIMTIRRISPKPPLG